MRYAAFLPAPIARLFQPVMTALALGGGLTSVALIVAVALGDALLGMLAAVMAFTISVPVLEPLLGADNRSARS
jgi:hypothetical protein